AIGKPLELELYNNRRSPRILLTLFDAQATTLTADEYALLDKAMKQLPETVEKMDMSPNEREALRRLLQRRDVLAEPPEPLVIREKRFTLAGVFRDLTQDEEKELPFYERLFRAGEVVIPQKAAMELCEKLPRRREEGYSSLTLIVDQEENVRPVVDQVKGMGLEHYSAVDF